MPRVMGKNRLSPLRLTLKASQNIGVLRSFWLLDIMCRTPVDLRQTRPS